MNDTSKIINRMIKIKAVNNLIDNSELVRMAEKHFDEESVKKIVKELKDNMKILISESPTN